MFSHTIVLHPTLLSLGTRSKGPSVYLALSFTLLFFHRLQELRISTKKKLCHSFFHSSIHPFIFHQLRNLEIKIKKRQKSLHFCIIKAFVLGLYLTRKALPKKSFNVLRWHVIRRISFFTKGCFEMQIAYSSRHVTLLFFPFDILSNTYHISWYQKLKFFFRFLDTSGARDLRTPYTYLQGMKKIIPFHNNGT